MAAFSSNGRGRRLPRAAAAALAVSLSSALLAGCGGGGAKKAATGGGGDGGSTTTVTVAQIALPADQPKRPACGVVSQAEVEAAIGAKVTAGKETNQDARSVCSYTLTTAADQVVLIVTTSSSGVPAAFESARAYAQGAQPINIGDQAFTAGAQAVVRKGTTMAAVLVTVRQQPAQLSASVTKLAQAIGSHI